MEDGDLINDEALRPHIHEKKWGEREVKKRWMWLKRRIWFFPYYLSQYNAIIRSFTILIIKIWKPYILSQIK